MWTIRWLQGPVYWHGLTSIPAWMNNHMPCKMWDEITYPFPNFNHWSLGMDKYFHPTFYNGCDNFSMLGLKLIHVSKRGHKYKFGRGQPEARFNNDFSIAIQIRWKFHFTLTSIVIQWSLQNFVHGMIAVLSWHVQKMVVIWWPAMELWEFSIKFSLWAKKVSETDPWSALATNMWNVE